MEGLEPQIGHQTGRLVELPHQRNCLVTCCGRRQRPDTMAEIEDMPSPAASNDVLNSAPERHAASTQSNRIEIALHRAMRNECSRAHSSPSDVSTPRQAGFASLSTIV